jgi:putative flippase GtrA
MLKKYKHYFSNKDTYFLQHLYGYLLVGCGNAILTIGLYTILITLLGVEYKIAFSISWLAGLVVTYIVNHIWVFKPEQKLKFQHRFGKYLAVYLSSYLISLYLMYLLVESFFIDPILAEFVVIPVIIVINFTGIKYWAMNKSGKPEKIILYLVFAALVLHFFSGIFPISRFESDSMGICNGCYEIIKSGDWGSNFFSYSYDMQAGTYWLIIIFMKLLSLPASVIYSLLSAIFGILCMVLITDILSMILKKDFFIIFIILFLFQEIYSISFYANSAVFAAFFWLLAFDIVYTYEKSWVYPVSVLLLGFAFWCRVDVAFAMIGIFPLLYLKNGFKKTISKSLITGVGTIITGLVLLKISGVNIAGFTHYSSDFAGVITKGNSNLGIINTFSVKSHLGFFSILLAWLLGLGIYKMIRRKEYKLLLFCLPIVIYYVFNSTHVFAAKHLYYNLIYFAIPVIYVLLNSSWKKPFSFGVIILFFAQYLLGWQLQFSAIPWQEKEYSQLYPYPMISKVLNIDVPFRNGIPLDIVLGSGTKIPTSDEIMLSSGIFYSPVMWQNLKIKYKKSFKILDNMIEQKQDVLYLSTSQSSSQFVFNILLENGWEYLPDQSTKFGFDKWHDFKKGDDLVRVYISRFKRDAEDFTKNFNKIEQSEFYHVAIWDWENYLLREELNETATPQANFVYKVSLDY